MKGYNRKIGDVYVLPLPYVTKPLPPLILHNPVSVAMYLYALLVTKNPEQIVHSGSIIKSRTANEGDPEYSLPAGVRIDNHDSAVALWQQGFFGKGTLSRSEPSWFGRTARRLGLDGGEMTLEEVTEMRRAKRRQFKRERDIQQKKELEEKLRMEGKIVGNADTASAAGVAGAESTTDSAVAEEENKPPTRDEDLRLITGDTILRLEYLHLHPCEAVFLSLGLGVLDITDLGSNLDALPLFFTNLAQWHEYIAYHYFRSLGWCARSGVKFGVDWLIYRRGPPFQHAEFAVMVMDDLPKSWAWLHSNMRVVSGAKKTLCLLHVNGPKELPDFSRIRTVGDFRAELAKNEVKTYNYTRFTPSRCRD